MEIRPLEKKDLNHRLLARKLHDKYEEFAKKTGWNTQQSCKVDFDELPESNKRTMLSLAKWLIEERKKQDSGAVQWLDHQITLELGEAQKTGEDFDDHYMNGVAYGLSSALNFLKEAFGVLEETKE